jgi:hypothetical protein
MLYGCALIQRLPYKHLARKFGADENHLVSLRQCSLIAHRFMPTSSDGLRGAATNLTLGAIAAALRLFVEILKSCCHRLAWVLEMQGYSRVFGAEGGATLRLPFVTPRPPRSHRSPSRSARCARYLLAI